MGIVAAVVGGITAVSGAAKQRKAGKKQEEALEAQAEERRKAEETQQKIRDLKTARERRQLVRQQRVQRAEIITGAAAGGTLTSSSAQTGAGSVVTQGASALSFLDQVQSLGAQTSIFNINAAKFGTEASAAGAEGREGAAITSLGTTLFTSSQR